MDVLRMSVLVCTVFFLFWPFVVPDLLKYVCLCVVVFFFQQAGPTVPVNYGTKIGNYGFFPDHLSIRSVG